MTKQYILQQNRWKQKWCNYIASYVDAKLLAPTQSYFTCLGWAIGKWDLKTNNSLGYSIMMNEKYSNTTKNPSEYKNHQHFKSGTQALYLFHLYFCICFTYIFIFISLHLFHFHLFHIFLLQKRRAVIYIVSSESLLHMK